MHIIIKITCQVFFTFYLQFIYKILTTNLHPRVFTKHLHQFYTPDIDIDIDIDIEYI